jgi:putative ATPase
VPKNTPSSDSLFKANEALKPLAERMRPATLDAMVGQSRLLASESALRRAIEAGQVHSMILWGPPGCGKTTLALLLANYANVLSSRLFLRCCAAFPKCG